MMGKSFVRTALRGCVLALFVAANRPAAGADETPITHEQFLLLLQQNQQLQQQLQTQQHLIESLTQKVSGLEASSSRRNAQPAELPAPPKYGRNSSCHPKPAPRSTGAR